MAGIWWQTRKLVWRKHALDAGPRVFRSRLPYWRGTGPDRYLEFIRYPN